ncbi:MAG: sulfatase-like hydrolase/transferase [Proteobacteria bacterium]|nr:sulfatase-like hydrolase/transferase [Pseudomonadota bacterium]
MSRSLVRLLLVAGIAVGIVVLLWQRDVVDPLRPLYAVDAAPNGTRILVVLDTVRADHLSACGYERPTSPVLESLATEAALTCSAIAPGSWTLPSHASFFSNRDLPDHGAHSVVGGDEMGLATAETVRPLGPTLPTLAERFGERGYQTLSVSGNPVVSPDSGLTRGFDAVRHPELFGEQFGAQQVEAVRDALRYDTVDDQPLFLFVNIADAHMPWWEVPSGLDWVPARDALSWSGNTFWADFFSGALAGDEKTAFLAHLTDVYDYGVYRSDETLGQVLDVVREYGWWTEDTRLVVTSDHGEFLGEHDLIDHGHYVYEENTGVPVLVSPPVELPEDPVSARIVHDLVLEGSVTTAPALSAALPHTARFERSGAFGKTTAGEWTDDGRVLWDADDGFDGEPSETLEEYVLRVRASGVATGELDPDLAEALRAAGYMD